MAQPPDQPPPQGGFGAPQMPPRPQGPPGYGHPQQAGPYGPPAAPGPYGPPQPQGPYGQPGSYGQPAGPYAQPPQPGYGYPPGAPRFPGAPGTPPPGPGPRGPFKGRPAMVVAAAVAALLVIGGVVFAVTGGGDDGKKPVAGASDDKKGASDGPVNPGDGSGDGGTDPQDLNAGRKAGEARVLWYKEAPDAPADGADAPGMWITSKVAAKAAYKEVVAYGVGDGKPAWDPITFPQKICSVTQDRTADDKIVVAYMSGVSDRAQCNQLQQIDLATGAKGWTAKVADGQLFDSVGSGIGLSLAGNTLVVGRSQSGVAYDARTGKKLYDIEKYGDSCFPKAFAGGARLVMVASCAALKADEHVELQELDPATGKAKWTRKLDKGWEAERVYSLDPLVVYSTNDDKNSWNISTFKADGSFRSQVGVDEDFDPQCGWALFDSDLTGCLGTAVDANTLYLPTDASGGANEIVALDLSTGKEKWRVKSPTDEPMSPMTTGSGRLVAYVEPSSGAGGRVVSIPTAGSAHTPTTLLQMPAGTVDLEDGFHDGDRAWADGRLYLSSTQLTGEDDGKEKLMLAYGK
ncbi:outer membrane protein assembly factor BamB family protein [Streptomyces griseoruber]|uniref:outer membrane protein assembly factor BamB family protein n=1 Tax=Streptomyces griseoruber TaxID=1943 RepID=UPI0037BBC096